jgi:hypothetical protein
MTPTQKPPTPEEMRAAKDALRESAAALIATQTPSAACEHCFCRTKTVAIDALAVNKKRVRYCCWCGEEKS